MGTPKINSLIDRKVLRGRIKFVIRDHKQDRFVRFDVDADTAQYLPAVLGFPAYAILDETGVHKLVGDLTVEQIEDMPVAATFFRVLGLIDHFVCRTDLFVSRARACFAKYVELNKPTILKS